jgi:hypothetical protein
VKNNGIFAICAHINKYWRLHCMTEYLKIMLSQMSKWNRIVNKYVPADVVERRMQHATVLRTAVVAAFNS